MRLVWRDRMGFFLFFSLHPSVSFVQTSLVQVLKPDKSDHSGMSFLSVFSCFFLHFYFFQQHQIDLPLDCSFVYGHVGICSKLLPFLSNIFSQCLLCISMHCQIEAMDCLAIQSTMPRSVSKVQVRMYNQNTKFKHPYLP